MLPVCLFPKESNKIAPLGIPRKTEQFKGQGLLLVLYVCFVILVGILFITAKYIQYLRMLVLVYAAGWVYRRRSFQAMEDVSLGAQLVKYKKKITG